MDGELDLNSTEGAFNNTGNDTMNNFSVFFPHPPAVPAGPAAPFLFPGQHMQTLDVLTILYVVLEMICCAAILLGNGLVIASFVIFPAIREKLPHHWLFHLAIADLAVGLALPFQIWTFLDFPTFERHSDNPYMCLIRYACAAICIEVSLVLLVMLAFHVLLSVKSPYKYNHWITPRKLHLTALLAWLCCIAYGIIPVAGKHNYGKFDIGAVCELAVVWQPWYIYSIICAKMILSAAVCAIYFAVFRVADKHARRDSAIFLRFNSTGGRNTKAIKTFLLVTVSTVVCFVPFSVTIFLQSYQFQVYGATSAETPTLNWVASGAGLAMFLHSCLNPIFYSLRLPAFRTAFKAILTCNCRDVKPDLFT